VTAPAPKKKAKASATVKIASGAANITKAGSYSLKVKLTKQGKKLIRRAKRLKLTVTMTFRDSAGRVSKSKGTVTLVKKKKKKS